jgi:hypothetical protein
MFLILLFEGSLLAVQPNQDAAAISGTSLLAQARATLGDQAKLGAVTSLAISGRWHSNTGMTGDVS